MGVYREMVVLLGDAALLVMVAAACGAALAATRPAGRRLLVLSLVAGVLANGALAVLLARGDWSVTYVVDHSRADTTILLRLAGLWAGAEGSFLLWTTLTCAAAVVAARLARPAVHGAVVRVGGVLAAVGGLVAVTVLDPFDRLAIPAVTGAGMQPILEHPAMLWHPPLLYGGMLGLLVPAVLAATDRGPDRVVTRRALAVALGLLTAGLATGGRWAYAELGWGGFWGWDPVENVALVAWAFGLAALHLPRRVPPSLVRISLGLPAVAVIWGTVLTRTYSVTSVHAFSSDPAIDRAILALGVVSTVVPSAAAVRARRGVEDLPAAVDTAAAVDRDPADRRATIRWTSAVIAVFVAVVVSAGTVAPMVRESVGGDESLVAGSYYARLVGPAVLAAGLVLAWFGRRWWLAGLGGAALAAGLAAAAGVGAFALVLAASAGAAGATSLAALAGRRLRWQPAIAHLGLAVLVLGVAGTTARSDRFVTFEPGETRTIAGHELTHRSVELVEEPARTVGRATLDVDGRAVHPSIVAHDLRHVRTTEFAQLLRVDHELQIAFVDGNAAGATYRVIRQPLLPLVWLGALVIVVALLGEGRRGGRTRLTVDDEDVDDDEDDDDVPVSRVPAANT